VRSNSYTAPGGSFVSVSQQHALGIQSESMAAEANDDEYGLKSPPPAPSRPPAGATPPPPPDSAASARRAGYAPLTLSKSSNDQLPINDLEHRWPISIIIAIGIDQISIWSCLLYLSEYAATFTFYTILFNTNQTIRDITIFRCRPNKDLLISVFLITPFNPTPGSGYCVRQYNSSFFCFGMCCCRCCKHRQRSDTG
jgi:hypothetical protein